MKLFYAPGACSQAPHIALHESGAKFEGQRVALKDGAQFQPDYLAVNPKSKVPALLRDDGSILTECPAILFWIGRSYPQAKLLPEDDATPDPPEPGAAPYITGAVIGGIYGVISEYRPEASAGFTGTYGIAAAALADPAGALGLDGDGAIAEPSPVGVASDLVFGAVLEGVRWLLGGRR